MEEQNRNPIPSEVQQGASTQQTEPKIEGSGAGEPQQPQQPPYGYQQPYGQTVPPRMPQGYPQPQGYRPYPQGNANGGFTPPPNGPYMRPANGFMPQPPKKPAKTSRNGWKVAIAAICSFVFLVSVLAGVSLSASLVQKSGNGDFTLPQANTAEENMGYLKTVQNSTYESVSDIAEDVGQSVVTIVVTTGYTDYFMNYTGESLGSGVIIGEEGEKIYIATNYHVIESAEDVSIIAGSDETTTIQAYYQGADEDTDLAVIYIKKSDVPEEVRSQMKIATLGDSANMRLGDLAIAIGSPVDKSFGNSVTVGTISGLERSVTFIDEDTQTSQTMTLMQTDAAINPGNSGGALVNGRGEVIGINNAKISSTDVEGMGFAIPANTAKPILEELINHGKISRPFIGITGGNVTAYEDFAAEYQLVSGVIVVSVMDSSPAKAAGLQMYDVILNFNGHTIDTFEDLTSAIYEAGIGAKVEVEVLRGYQEGEPQTVTLQLTIGEKNSTGR